jgi:hypothetical protein
MCDCFKLDNACMLPLCRVVEVDAPGRQVMKIGHNNNSRMTHRFLLLL